MTDEKIVCAGFSGQGVMSIGQLLAYTGMDSGLEVSWVPSYGPEMRGGTANCSVMISESPIGSPLVAGDATAIIVLNSPSLDKFESQLVPDGIAFINSTLIKRSVERDDIRVHYIPANELGDSLGSARFANMIMLGSFIALAHPFSLESVVSAMDHVFHECDDETKALNIEALFMGYRHAKDPN